MPPVDTATAGTKTFTVTATDGNGTTTSDSHTYTVVDDNDPPTAVITRPTEGQEFSLGQYAMPLLQCDDTGGSQLQSCDSSTNFGAIDTSTLGEHTITLTARDFAGHVTTVTRHYMVTPEGPLMTFTIDPGATFTEIEPTYTTPVTTLPPVGLSGSYTVSLQAYSDTPGTHYYKITAMHLETTTGIAFDLTYPGTLWCNDTTAKCRPVIQLETTTFHDNDHIALIGWSLAEGEPTLEGSQAHPTGFDWAPANASTPPGVGAVDYTSHTVGVFAFHATRVGIDTTPPTVSLYTPANGDQYAQGQNVPASWSCFDNESGLESCNGTLNSGALLDTSTLGTHSFTLTGRDFEGNTTTVTHTYTVIPPAPVVTYYVDPGGLFTPTVPTSSAPVTTLPAEGLSGSYTVQYQPWTPYFGAHTFLVTAMHLSTPSGVAFDLTSGTGQLICFDQSGGCQPQVNLTVTGMPGVPSAILQTTGLAIGTPTPEGPRNSPTGFNWSPPNTYVPSGVGLYYGSQIVGVVGFHASLNPPDTTPPAITLGTPIDGAQFSLGQNVAASYSCTDAGGSGLASCDGPVLSGDAIDTSTPGVHVFNVNAADTAGNISSASATYEVLAGNVSTTVSGGELVTTDPGGAGASAAVPVQTQIQVPSGVSGALSVTPQAAGSPPAGFALFSKQVAISAPPATSTAAPYVATFTVDASELAGVAPADIAVFRNGTLVADCTSATDAVPDPCVAARGAVGDGSGDAFVTVRTTQFSTWTLGYRLLSVSTVSPGSRAQGATHQLVGITGTAFKSGATVSVSGTGVTVNSAGVYSSTTILADVSVDPAATVGVRNVTVTNPGGASVTCTGCFRVNAKPTIASVSPAARPVGAVHQALTVTGTGFQSGATVSLGAGITVHSVQFVDAAHLTLDVSVATNAAVGARSATVTNPDAGTATKAAAFTVNPVPTATAVSPNSVRQAQTATVQITGTGFQSGATVSFGSDVTVNSVTFNASNKLTVSLTPGTNAVVGAHAATVTNPDGGRATCANCLTVVAIPHVTSVSPASRPVGASAQTITVTGSGYAVGVTAKFSGTGVTINSLTRTSATSLKLVVSVAGRRDGGRPQPHAHQPGHGDDDLHQLLHGEREADDHIADAELAGARQDEPDGRAHRHRVPDRRQGHDVRERRDRDGHCRHPDEAHAARDRRGERDDGEPQRHRDQPRHGHRDQGQRVQGHLRISLPAVAGAGFAPPPAGKLAP